MKIILLSDIYKTGVTGEVVNVADGYARNYLIPRGMAKPATDGALKAHQKLMNQVDARRAQYENMLNDLARQIDGTELIFERRASTTGTLYGSVTTQEMADALLEATGVDINRRRISQQSIRELGEFDIPVRLGTEISPLLHLIVIREGELDEFLAAREAGEEYEIGEGSEVEAAAEEVPAELQADIDEAEVAEVLEEQAEAEVAEVEAEAEDQAE